MMFGDISEWHLRLLQSFDFVSHRRAFTSVASVLLGVEPRAIGWAMKVIGKDVEVAGLFIDLSEATLVLGIG